jgi:hypothetical protein
LEKRLRDWDSVNMYIEGIMELEKDMDTQYNMIKDIWEEFAFKRFKSKTDQEIEDKLARMLFPSGNEG